MSSVFPKTSPRVLDVSWYSSGYQPRSVTPRIHDPHRIHHINQCEIYVINLRSNTLRRKYMELVLKKMEINYHLVVVDFLNPKRVQPIDIPSAPTLNEKGCLLSHMWCLHDYLERKKEKEEPVCPHLLLLEDDVVFHKQFHTLFDHVYDSLCRFPKESKDNDNDNNDNNDNKADFIMLGALDYYYSSTHCHNVLAHVPAYQPKQYKRILGAHANLYTPQSAYTWLQRKRDYPESIDYGYDTLFTAYRGYICAPNLICTEMSTSNLNHFGFLYNEQHYKLCFTRVHLKDYHYLFLQCFMYSTSLPLHMNKDTTDEIIEEQNQVKAILADLYANYVGNRKYPMDYLHEMDVDFFTLEDIVFLLQK